MKVKRLLLVILTVFSFSGTSLYSQCFTVQAFNITAPASSVCAGTSVLLVAATTPTTTFPINYVWAPTNPVQTGALIFINPTVTTVYTVVATGSTCVSTATVLVMVDQGPVITVTDSPTITCPGGNVNLGAFAPQAVGGFTWNPGNITGNPIVVNPAVTTTYSVSATNSAGCVSTYTRSHFVAPVPIINITPSSPSVCVGSTLIMTASGGSSYTWNPPAGPFTNSIAVSPSVNTNYTVIASNGTCTSSFSTQVQAVPLPTVNASATPSVICRLSSSNLMATGATNYTWVPGPLFGSNVSVSPNSTTVYTVTGSAAGCSSTRTVMVTVNQLPTVTAVANPTAVCPGFCSSITPNGAVTYTITGGTFSVCPSVTTTYSISGTGSLGCVSATPGTITVVVNPTPNINVSSSSPTVCAGSCVTLTGTGGSIYNWMPGGLSGPIISVCPSVTTTYTLTGANAFGCVTTRTITITVIPAPNVNASANPAAICIGGSSTLTATGATSYIWQPGGMTGAIVSVSPLVNTTYTVTGTSGGCSATRTVVVTVNPLPSINVSANPPSVCPGNCSTLTATGGISYTWSTGSGNSSISVCPVTPTTYTVRGANAAGCVAQRTINIGINPVPAINIFATSGSVCAGSCATLSGTGASSYTWMPGNVNGAIRVVCPTVTTTYTLFGSNPLGCVSQSTVTIIAIPVPTINASASPASVCIGDSTTLMATGATNYTWMPGSLSGPNVIVQPLATTVYTVTGNSGGCSGTRTVQVTVNPLPNINISPSQASVCPGFCSTLLATGGVSYTWSTGSNANPIVVCPTVATTYSVRGASAFGCTNTRTINIGVRPTPVINVNPPTPSICAGSSVTLTASGASTFTWNTGSIGAIIIVTPPVTTSYTVQGTSPFGCIGQRTVTVTVNPNPPINAISSPPAICVGSSANLLAIGGAVSYLWMPGNLSGANVTVSPVVTTVYTVTGTSANGCTATASTTLTVNNNPNVNVTANPPSICAGANSTLTATGATSYSWNTGATSNPIVVSPSVTTVYTVTGSNASGCSTTRTVVVTVFPVPALNAIASPSTICAGQTAVLSATGAVSYNWMPGNLSGASVSVSPLVSTVYTVTGTNSFSCSAQRTVAVNVLANPIVNATSNPAAICRGNSATLSATGASSYLWNFGSSQPTVVVSPTLTTTYSVIGTTGLCSSMATVQVVVNAPPAMVVNATPPSICQGGSSTLTATGATSFTWQPGNLSGGSIVVTPPVTTVYSVTGSNALNCTATSTLMVTVNPNPTLNPTANPTVVCSGQSSTLSATGATGYTWFPGNQQFQSIIVTPITSTNYTVIGSLGTCTASATRVVIVTPLPNINAFAIPASICVGGTSTLTAVGGINYTWMPGGGTGNTITVSPVVTTNYTVTGVNVNGCVNTRTVNVFVNPVPTVSVINPGPNPICSGSSATLIGSGANVYSWTPGGISQSIVVSPNVTTTYTLRGTNGFGCNDTVLYTLNVNPTPTIIASASSNSVCSGFTTALTATGANSYTWYPGGLTGNPVVITPTASTLYTVTGESNNCTASAFIPIIVVPLPNINATANPAVICSGGTSTLTATGAASYTWIPGFMTGNSVTVSPVASEVYTVAGQAVNGCPNFTTVAVNVLPAPNVAVSANPNPLCIGGSATLTASGASSYNWMPGGGSGSQLVVSPSTSTTYTVTGITAGCTGSATILVSVNPLPVISASSSSPLVCAGSIVNLMATGAQNYTWNPPIGQFGPNVSDAPLSPTTYSVLGQDANGCYGSATVFVQVNPLPVISAAASPPAICNGGIVNLSANGAVSYMWNPGGFIGANVSDSPQVTTTYTVSGTDNNNCTGTATVLVTVLPTPTISVSPISTTICLGNSATLTATGASGYTWLPAGAISPVLVASPLSTTIYTVIGSNGGSCSDTFTAEVVVNSPPANVVAVCNGTVTCLTPSVDLFGASSDPNVSYMWFGPQSYSSSLQNPTGVTVWGTFTLNVTDNITGCVTSVTVEVPTDGSIPLVTATTSGSITCSVFEVTLNAVHSTTNPGYNWSGPGGFSSIGQTFTVDLHGVYTVTVTDLTSTCASTAMVTVGIHTNVEIVAFIIPATCLAGISNNDGTILVANYNSEDRFDLVAGESYTGSATYSTAIQIPGSGIITNNLANPADTVAYTIRLFDSEGCVMDTTLYLVPVDCIPKTLGLAKSVSEPVRNDDGTYDMQFSIVVQNLDTIDFDHVIITDDLTSTFPSPASFTVTGGPTISSINSNLILIPGYNGVNQLDMTAMNSFLAAGHADTLTFTVRVDHAGNFGPYYNSATGSAVTIFSVAIRDSSNTGFNPDPDGDGDASNNNTPTEIKLNPKLFFGLTKAGSFYKTDNNTYNVTYTITVHNLGEDTLVNVNVNDSLFRNTVRDPATYEMVSAPVTTGGLNANPLFDGKNDIRLLADTINKIAPGETSTIRFTINVNTGTVTASTTLRNSAYGSAFNVFTEVAVSDTSNNGSNPDTNNNGVWNEPADNVPTVIVLPSTVTHTLFIPEGFSPNGDFIHDVFFIKGLPEGENSLTVYNRWGNKVYQNTNYDNSWDGTPNVSGSLGKNRLPKGTYYFVLELKGTESKTITGFVVINY